MRLFSFSPPCGRHAVTLIEMLTVLFVISILVASIVGTTRYASHTSEMRRAKADLHLLGDAVDRFQLRFGELPNLESHENRATKLLEFSKIIPGSPGNSEIYYFSNSLPHNFTALDPWGKPYIYERFESAADGSETYTISSSGPDPNNKERYHDELTL